MSVNGKGVCIIAVIGKSSLIESQRKDSCFHSLFEKSNVVRKRRVCDWGKCYVDEYYDEVSRAVYLHVVSILDTYHVVNILDEIPDDMDFFEFCANEEALFGRLILAVMLLSHIVVVSSPSTALEVRSFRFFRAIDSLRVKLKSHISKALSALDENLSREWIEHARLCAPRILLLLTIRSSDGFPENIDAEFHRTIENQYYDIFRATDLIKHAGKSSLFSISMSDAFVFFCRQTDSDCELSYSLLDSIQAVDKRSTYNETERPSRSSLLEANSWCSTSFKSFIFNHIKCLLFGKFMETSHLSCDSVDYFFVLPEYPVWEKAFDCITNLFSENATDLLLRKHFQVFRSCLNVDAKLSKKKSDSAFYNALEFYEERLPAFYSRGRHNRQLNATIQYFKRSVRARDFHNQIGKLKDECAKIWSTRRACECISLTGHMCIHPIHRTPSFVDAEDSKLPVIKHESNYISVAASDCGRFQRERTDPFTLKDANYQFYMDMRQKYADTVYFEFPIFSITAEETADDNDAEAVSASIIKDILPQFDSSESEHSNKPRDESGTDTSQSGTSSPILSELGSNNNNLLSPSALKADIKVQEGLSECRVTRSYPESNCTEETSQSNYDYDSAESDISRIQDKDAESSKSTKYLSGMVTSLSPKDLLPLFSSWSLCFIGDYHDYKPESGLDQPGFLHNTNYLLPWDICLFEKTAYSPNSRGSDSFARAYIGCEYECPSGHRFICSNPDRIVKVQSGVVKDSGSRLVETDMPIFTPCICKNRDGSNLSQLMRVFVITPNTGRLSLTLRPRVQPGSDDALNGLLFIPSYREPIYLTPGLIWVLRLPYVYMGVNNTVYSRSISPSTLARFKILKGLFGYVVY